MADSPDQHQLKTQAWTHVACELKQNTLSIENTSGLHEKTTYPTLRQEHILCFLGPLRGMLRGYASGLCFILPLTQTV